jgi:hypothetical protein
MTTTAITPLRQRMIEDMSARKLCVGTQSGHIRRLHSLRHNSGNRIIPATDRQQLYFLENRGVAGT